MESEKYINNLLEKGDLESLSKIDNSGLHYLRLLATEHTKNKDLISINYKTDLKSGIYLDPWFSLTNDGLLKDFCHLYNGKHVIHVSYSYKYLQEDLDNDDIPLSSKEVIEKTKLWEFYYPDGTLDTSDTDNERYLHDRITSKEKIKHYNTRHLKIELGSKRRKNIEISASNVLGVALVLLGIVTSNSDAVNKMLLVSETFNKQFTQYREWGSDTIYSVIESDTSLPFLNVTFPTNVEIDLMVAGGLINETQKAQMLGAVSLYGMEDLQGRTLKNYLIEKLKGNLK